MSPAVERESAISIGAETYSIVSDDTYLDHVGSDFEPEMVRLFRLLIAATDVVVDVGANIGLTTILFARLAERVISFEASPSTYKYLKINVNRTALHNVTLVNKGLGNDNITSEITFSPDNRAGGFVSDRTHASVGHIVETIQICRLDDIVSEVALERIDFLKLDVEGYEKFVMMGAKGMLARCRPVVVLELNHWCLNAFQRISVPDFFDYLRTNFPIVLAIHGGTYLDLHDQSDSYIAMYRHIVQGQFSNVLCAFDEARLTRFREVFTHA